MSHFKILFVAIAFTCLVFPTNAQIQQSPSLLIYGEVIDTINCKNSPSQTYSLYLPKNYSPERSWPILYFFEPAARGNLPLTKYKEVAEKFEFIFVCSNNSKNGSWETVFDAAEAIFKDTQEKFNIDENRIYTTGFSGGARAAITLVLKYPKISGVIGCGAGFSVNPDHRPTSAHKNLRYVGIVGNRDMNYLEQFRVAEFLNKLNIPNLLITFKGKHTWPPVENFNQAMEWLAFQQNLKTPSPNEYDDLISKYFLKRKAELSNSDQMDILNQARLYHSFITDFKNILNVDDIEEKLRGIEKSKKYQKEKKDRQKIISRELLEREKYLQALYQIPYNNFFESDSIQYWWKMERNALHRLENNKDSLKSTMASRVLNLIWATCAEKGWGALRAENFEDAKSFFYLWTIIQNESHWPYLNLACAHSLQNNKKEAIKILKKATELGSISGDTIENIQAFNNIRNETDYIKILNTLPRE